MTDTGDRVRYLDVYIVNGSDGLMVSGYTLHDRLNIKTDGFNGGVSAPDEPFTGKARFETVNITLTNKVEGNMGDKQHQFPFEGILSDSGRYVYASKGTAPQASEGNKLTGGADGISLSTTLSDGEVYYISGISKQASVAYQETNNTSDTYMTAIEGGTPSQAQAVAPGGVISMSAASASDSLAVRFINTLDAVSPTGVVMRYGMPLVLLAAGAAILILQRRMGGQRKI